MANHGYVTTKTKITAEKLHEALTTINEKRFGGRIKIECFEDAPGNWGHATHIINIYDDCSIPMWLASSRKIETRHSNGADLVWWVESVFLNDLAVTFDGQIGDDGTSGRWKGVPGKHKTYKDYLEATHAHNKFKRLLFVLNMREARKLRPDLKKWLK